MNIEKEPIEVFSGTIWESEMVKSLLESEGINGFLINNAGTVFPFDVTESGTAAVKIMVDAEDYAASSIIVEKYLANKADSEN
ncbi:putative signal transducing protein [Daejeonella oryzae]|uniref:putative signal transducing protein n=1 Tax=Daejeonella oryzae TaxID=1122943 RepID=UPI0003FBC14E|nr:DUF2007 domain-containing protein [Daejeonella oryzae]